MRPVVLNSLTRRVQETSVQRAPFEPAIPLFRSNLTHTQAISLYVLFSINSFTIFSLLFVKLRQVKLTAEASRPLRIPSSSPAMPSIEAIQGSLPRQVHSYSSIFYPHIRSLLKAVHFQYLSSNATSPPQHRRSPPTSRTTAKRSNTGRCTSVFV